MSDIELVIKIPEDTYKHLCNGGSIGASLLIENAIKNGTLLPEEHGHIIDISKIEYLKVIHDAKNGKISWSDAIKQIKNSAPTIIESNKGK